MTAGGSRSEAGALIDQADVAPAGVKPMTARELLDRLQRHYIKPGDLPGGLFVPECGINGSARQRRADALYVGFTSASGRLLVGHEIKVARSDWLKELDTAGKADFWADNCHAWYIVAPGPDVAPPEEIPDGWGLMYPNPRRTTRMQVVIKPTVHRDRHPSWHAVRSIMARTDTLRAQHDTVVKRQALDDARKTAEQEHAARAQHDRRLTSQERERLDTLDRLEELVGQKVRRWTIDGDDTVDVHHLAAALRLVTAAGGLEATRAPVYASDTLRRHAEKLLAGLGAFTEARDAIATLLEVAPRGQT